MIQQVFEELITSCILIREGGYEATWASTLNNWTDICLGYISKVTDL